MRSHLASALHASLTLLLVTVALVVTPVAAQQANPSNESRATLTVSAVVMPSCIFDVTPHETGGASVAVRCQATDLTHARIRVQDDGQASAASSAGPQGTLRHVPGSPAVVRTEVHSGSLLQIDF
jgi:hypothetical protein